MQEEAVSHTQVPPKGRSDMNIYDHLIITKYDNENVDDDDDDDGDDDDDDDYKFAF